MEKHKVALESLDPYRIRNDFPIFERKIRGKPLIYFDNAATTQKPKPVIEVEKRFYEETNANIHRAVHTLSYESTVLYEESHKKVANFIGAKNWREIIFTRNATESINLVAYGWGLHNLRKGDEVLITIMEHHSNIVPWQMLRDQKGITLKILDVDDEGRLKLDELEPFLYGGDMIETVTIEKSTWNELPWKYEAGTPNIAGGIGLGAAVDYLNRIGVEKIFEHEREIVGYSLERMSDFPWIELYGPRGNDRVGVVLFNISGVHPHDVAGILDEEGIAVRSGHHCAQPLMRRLGMDIAVRASFYLYNTKEEVDKFVEVLREVRRLF